MKGRGTSCQMLINWKRLTTLYMQIHLLLFTKNVKEHSDSDKINENWIANDKTPDNHLIFPS